MCSVFVDVLLLNQPDDKIYRVDPREVYVRNMVVRLHHVEVLCKNLQHSLKQFCGQFGFKVLAESFSPKRVAIRRNAINFVLTEGRRDTVFNVAFEVKDIGHVLSNVETNSGKVLRGPETLTDSDGEVDALTVQTPVGNVLHTLLNTSRYEGVFLPGFGKLNISPARIRASNDFPNIRHFDHITFACPQGTSKAFMDWYSKCFGFSRFVINSDEAEDGFVVQSHIQGARIGIKLTAMEYWLCAETGLTVPTEEPGGGVKFVFAEPLPGQGLNQIQTFLEEHDGPGIQHIGLHTPDITQAVSTLKSSGVQLINPPDAYYTQVDKMEEIQQAGESVQNLRRNGILLDTENFQSDSSSHLMQVFTKPLFDKDTFFLEVIQRCGATGFGAGNITALWRAMDAYLTQAAQVKDSYKHK